jgi:hypothetical protein
MTDAPTAHDAEVEAAASASLPAPSSSPQAPAGPAADVVVAGPPSTAAYRTPPAVEATSPLRVPRPPSLVGAVLFVSGVLLWAFVVMGELTTSYGPGKHGLLVGEALAVVFVLATSAAAWGVALRRSLEATPPSSPQATYVRGAVLAVLPLAVWLVVLFGATALGKSASRDIDGPVSALLLLVSVAAALGGRRMAGLRGRPSTSRHRVLTRLTWVAAGLLTVVATAEILVS